ncbi:MAG: hypothetical protein ABIP33_06490 [Pseudolysinimonas sp.]
MTFLVHIGGLTFDASPSAGGSALICSRLDGWYPGAPIRGKTDDQPVGDGAFGSVKNYRSARPLTFTGWMIASSSIAAFEALSDQFAALQADGTPIILSVENDAGIRSLTVSIDGVPDIQPVATLAAASVTVSFVAYDPVKYGASSAAFTGLPTSGGGLEYPLGGGGGLGQLFYGANGQLGRVTLVNNGTAAVFPTFSVTGQLDAGFYLQCLELGNVIRYDRVVPLGSTIGLDSRTESVTVDGVQGGSTYLTRFEWFSVPAKSSLTVQLNSLSTFAGAPQLTVTNVDGFL